MPRCSDRPPSSEFLRPGTCHMSGLFQFGIWQGNAWISTGRVGKRLAICRPSSHALRGQSSTAPSAKPKGESREDQDSRPRWRCCRHRPTWLDEARFEVGAREKRPTLTSRHMARGSCRRAIRRSFNSRRERPWASTASARRPTAVTVSLWRLSELRIGSVSEASSPTFSHSPCCE